MWLSVVTFWRKKSIYLCNIIKKKVLNSDVQQFNQYQQNEQSPPNSDGQQFYQYQQIEQSPLNSDGQQFTNINETNNHL